MLMPDLRSSVEVNKEKEEAGEKDEWDFHW